jgi:hypothetical protein
MSRYNAPNPLYENARNSQWLEAAPHGMRSPDHLWGKYWQRFNTFEIPIFDRVEYFQTAMDIAKVSKSEQDFERRFEEKNQQRRGLLESVLNDMFWQIKRRAPFDAENSDERTLGSLENFVAALCGYILDQKKKRDSANIVVEKQASTGETPLQENGQKITEDETDVLIGGKSRSPSADPENEKYSSPGKLPDDDDDCYSQLPHDVDWGYEFEQEYKARQARHIESNTFLKEVFESLMSTTDDTASYMLKSNEDILSIEQAPSLVSNDSQDPEEANEIMTQDGKRRRSSISSESSINSAKKRVRFDDDEDISNHEPKRRKLDNALAHSETFSTPQISSSSSAQAVHGSASRKRSRSDEDEVDNGYKRQKIETLPRPSSPISSSNSTRGDSTNHPAQGVSERVLEEQVPESNNGGRKRRKQKPTSPTSRVKTSRSTLNTRSSRRAEAFALLELDSSGKPRLTY